MSAEVHVRALLQKSERNLRRALLMLETCRVLQNPMSASQEPQLPDWELYIQVCHLRVPGLGGSHADICAAVALCMSAHKHHCTSLQTAAVSVSIHSWAHGLSAARACPAWWRWHRPT